MTIPNTLYQSTIKLEPKNSPITHPPFLQFQNVAFIMHLSMITWHSCYILVYMDPLAYCLTSIWSSFGMFAASALLVVLENPPAHSSLYGPRNAVQDDTSLRHGVAVGHGLRTSTNSTRGQQCRLWLLLCFVLLGGWLMVDHQAKVARMIFSWPFEVVVGNDRRTVQLESRWCVVSWHLGNS